MPRIRANRRVDVGFRRGVEEGDGVPVRVYGARESTHNRIDADLGVPDDPGTKALFDFVGEALKK
jgi:hypothetical protein